MSTMSQSQSTQMHGYGAEWFENLNNLGTQYAKQHAEQEAAAAARNSKAPLPMHSYGDSWFENLNTQRVELERRKSEQSVREEEVAQPHNYGDTWFENLHDQGVQYEQTHPHAESQQHGYGNAWFENLNGQRLEYEETHPHPQPQTDNYGRQLLREPERSAARVRTITSHSSVSAATAGA